jgi:CheY-like chemotaxis protein
LYVEDDAPSRKVVELIMQRAMGVHNLVIFPDSVDFMTRLKALPMKPDIILMDIHIRPQDGFTLLSQIRADPACQHIKVVAVTASVMNEEVERLRACGFDGAVGKPLNMGGFPALMERILDGEMVWYVS